MTDHQGEMTPAVWDPSANGGAGGWVRRPAAPGAPRPAAAPPAGGGPVPPPPATANPYQAGPAPTPPATANPYQAGPAPTPPTAGYPAAGAPPSPMAPPPTAGSVGDQGPPLTARPYLQSPPATPPAPPAAPPAGAPTGYGYPPPNAHPAQPGPPNAHQTPPAYPGRPSAHPAPPGPPSAPLVPPPPGAPGGYGYPPQARPPQPGAGYAGHPGAPGAPPAGGYGYPPAPQAAPSWQPGGLDLPGQYQDEEDDEGRPSRRTPLLIGAGLVLLLAIGGGVALTMQGSGSNSGKAATAAVPPTAGAASPSAGGATAAPSAGASDSASAGASDSGSPSAGPNAQNEAQSLDALLTQGEAAKAPIGSAVAQVESCPAKADIDAAAQTFSSGADQRDKLLGQLSGLNVADLPGGADAVQSLKTAWQTSADIDRAYAAWAKSVSASGCGGKTAPDTADKQKADQLNPQATQAKKDFVAKWNALAGTYNLASRTWDRI